MVSCGINPVYQAFDNDTNMGFEPAEVVDSLRFPIAAQTAQFSHYGDCQNHRVNQSIPVNKEIGFELVWSIKNLGNLDLSQQKAWYCITIMLDESRYYFH